MSEKAIALGEILDDHAESVPADCALSPELRAFYQHWDRARDGKDMPTRADLSLTPIKQYLRHIHMYDVVDAGRDFFTRVMGTGVFLGKNPDTTGQLLSQHPDTVVRARLNFSLREVVNTAAPRRVLRERPGRDRFHATHVESIYLPLGTAQSVEQIIAMSIFKHVLRPAGDVLPVAKSAPAGKHRLGALLVRIARMGRAAQRKI